MWENSLHTSMLSIFSLYYRCKPVYVSYQFYKQPLHESAGRQQGSDVFWEDVNVVLLGTLDKRGLAEYLQGPQFQIEVHDRERKIEQKKPKPSLFGENPEDEMINNVSLVAGMRMFFCCCKLLECLTGLADNTLIQTIETVIRRLVSKEVCDAA